MHALEQTGGEDTDKQKGVSFTIASPRPRLRWRYFSELGQVNAKFVTRLFCSAAHCGHLSKAPPVLTTGTATRPSNGITLRGAWGAQLVKRPTLGFGSGHGLAFRGFQPRVRLCADGVEPAWGSLSLPLSLPLSRLLSPPLSK